MRNKMKQIPIALSAALVLLGLVSCTRDKGLEPEAQSSVNPYLSVKHSITLEVEPSLSENELRAMGLEYDEQLRAVTFDISGSGPRVSASTDSWKTYLFFRKKGDDAHVGYAEYEFIQGPRVSYVVGGVTKTKIVLKPKQLTTTLVGVPAEPALGEEWYVSGITGGGTLDPTTMRVSVSNDYSQTQPLTTMNVPFSFDWMPLEIEKRGTLVLGVAKPTFKPQGALIKVSVKNTLTAASSTFSRLALDPANTPISGQGYFDFSAARYNGTQVASGASLHWESTHSTATPEYKMDYNATWTADQQRIFMFWGMPLAGSPKTGLVFSGYDNFLRTYNSSSSKWGSILSEKVLVSGKSYRLNVEIRRPKLPIEYVAQRNIAGGVGRISDIAGVPGTSGPLRFAINDENDQSGYYNLTEIVPAAFAHLGLGPTFVGGNGLANNPNSIDLMDMTVDGRKLKDDYFVPTLLHWMAVFPFAEIDSRPAWNSYLSLVEYILIGDGITRGAKFGSDLAYRDGILYGLRFRPVKPTDDDSDSHVSRPLHPWQQSYGTPEKELVDITNTSTFRELQSYDLYSAYRYRWVNNAIVVNVVYLGGAGLTTTIDDMSDPQWWRDREANWITRTFPITGRFDNIYFDPNVAQLGTSAKYVSYASRSASLAYQHDGVAHLWISKNSPSPLGYSVSSNSWGDYWIYHQYETLRLFTKHD